MKWFGWRMWHGWVLVTSMGAVACGGGSKPACISGVPSPGCPYVETPSDATAPPKRLRWNDAIRFIAQELSTTMDASLVPVIPDEDDAGGKQRVRIAITPFTTPDQRECAAGWTAADELVGPLMQSGKFDLIERSRLNAVAKELDIGASDWSDPEKTAALGRQLGAAALVFGTIGTGAGDVPINARIVIVETSQIAASGRIDVPGNDVVNKGTCVP